MRRNGMLGADTLPGLGRLMVGSEVRALVRDLPMAAAVLDSDGHAWLWNAAAQRLFPPPPQTATATYPLFSLNGQPWFDSARAAALQGRATSGLQWRLRGLGGSHHQVGVALSPVHEATGMVTALLAVMHDTTARDRAYRRAVRRVRWGSLMLDNLPDPVLLHRGGRIVYANRPALRLFGAASRRQLIGRDLDACVVPISHEQSGQSSHARVHRLDGTTREAELQSQPFVFRNRKATNITLREVSAATNGAGQSKVRSRTANRAGNGVIMLDAVGYISTWNTGLERLTGYSAEEIIGRDLSILDISESAEHDAPGRALRGAIAHGRFDDEGWKLRKDGSRFWCQLVVSALYGREHQITGFAAMINDRTTHRTGDENAQTEEQLRQAQRMEAIGRLAGGIAHDFNNLLTAIQGHSQFLLDDLPEAHPSLQDALEIRKSADRATALTRQLLTFSRRQELRPKIINLNEIIGEMGTLLRRVINEDVLLHVSLDPELAPVRADSGQIEQVIMNLVVNARDAMPRGGSITVRTGNVELDDAYAERKLDVGPGPYVLLSVTDTGVGMDRETQAHIFEPFFTTKDHGKGTGLGLSTVYGIVKQSGGHIWVYSEPGHGTTFKIYLPRVAASGEILQRPPRLRDAARPGETILLVEDEPAVRNLARRVLEARGYAVLEAGTGLDAIRVASGRSGPIHLMLSDVVVPEMNGSAIAHRLHEKRPAVKLLFMSGYNDEDVKLQGIVEAGAPFIEKPFTPDLLAKRVREVLDTPE
ncbi:MAG: PAS domain-containing protein [Longimicrobiales bacterium]